MSSVPSKFSSSLSSLSSSSTLLPSSSSNSTWTNSSTLAWTTYGNSSTTFGNSTKTYGNSTTHSSLTPATVLVPSSTDVSQSSTDPPQSIVTTSPPPSSASQYYSTIFFPDKTITTQVTVPTAAEDAGNNDAQTGKLVGGIVGGVCGCLVVGALAFLFLLWRRRGRVLNPLPDFADDNLKGNRKKFGFKNLFGTNDTPPVGTRGISGFNDLENQFNVKSAAMGAAGDTQYGSHDAETGFKYRGVSTSNNLESVFWSGSNSRRNSGGLNSSTGSTRQPHMRYDAMGLPPMDPMAEGDAGDEFVSFHDETPKLSDQDRSLDFEYADDIMLRADRLPIFAGDHHSNNSRLRFTEEI